MSEPLLKIEDLSLSLDHHHAGVRVVDRVSLQVERGESLGIVGESGSGKSLTLRAAMGLLPAAVRVDGGTVTLAGESLAFSGRTARRQRRRRLAMVFQDSLTALDPVYTVGSQIAEVLHHVLGLPRAQAKARTIELLDLVGIRDPRQRAQAYPHELSGGMRQRAMLAVALATEPEVLLCDEPTTALDVTVQAQVLTLLADLQRDLGLALLFVSHDLAVVRQLCSELAVMYAGRIVETGPTEQLLARPLHPYTRGLLDATIDLDRPQQVARPIRGSIPEPGHLPSGCSFHPRCDHATDECALTEVSLAPVELGVQSADPVVGGPLAADLAPVGRASARAGRESACLHWQELATR
jgi:oligopeptide/dipeptide ABC transporter ATP-binding protein